MFSKVLRATLLILLTAFYVNNVMTHLDNWYGVVVYNRLNFIILVAILYLASTFFKFFEVFFAIVLIGGILFHGHMYYKTYRATSTTEQEWNSGFPKAKKCSGKGVNWYTKLNDSCY